MKFCDCGQTADKRDGSGWSCVECRTMIERVSKMITDLIHRQRAETRFEESEGSATKLAYRVNNWNRHIQSKRDYRAA